LISTAKRVSASRDQGADPVDRLHAGRIVIERDDNFAATGQFGADLRAQRIIRPFGGQPGQEFGGGGRVLIGERHRQLHAGAAVAARELVDRCSSARTRRYRPWSCAGSGHGIKSARQRAGTI